jgi:hypothetical protein
MSWLRATRSDSAALRASAKSVGGTRNAKLLRLILGKLKQGSRSSQSIHSSQQGQMSNSYRSLRHRNQRSLTEISLTNFENAC